MFALVFGTKWSPARLRAFQRVIVRSGSITLLSLVAITALAEQDWPQFRGPRGDGTSMAVDVPLTWNETNNIAWKIPVPGRGRSSPVVLTNRLFLTTALEQGVQRTRIGSDDMQTAEHVALEAVCLSTDNGETVWRTRLFEVDKPDPVRCYNSS